MNVSWKEYLDHRFEALKELFVVENQQRQRALDIAHREIDRRLETMNEFRAQLSTERAGYVGTQVYDQHRESVDARLRTVETGLANVAGRFVIVGLIVSLVGGSMGAAVVTFLLRGR